MNNVIKTLISLALLITFSIFFIDVWKKDKEQSRIKEKLNILYKYGCTKNNCSNIYLRDGRVIKGIIIKEKENIVTIVTDKKEEIIISWKNIDRQEIPLQFN